MDKPIPIPTTQDSFASLKESVQNYIDFIDNDEEYNEDELDNYEHDIFEKAVTAIYGRQVWDWINKRRD